jgi:hypothetical protein
MSCVPLLSEPASLFFPHPVEAIPLAMTDGLNLLGWAYGGAAGRVRTPNLVQENGAQRVTGNHTSGWRFQTLGIWRGTPLYLYIDYTTHLFSVTTTTN